MPSLRPAHAQSTTDCSERTLLDKEQAVNEQAVNELAVNELAVNELAVNELAARVGKPAPSVSQHLAGLSMTRLVRTRAEGTQVFYRLENEQVARLVGETVYNAEHSGPEVSRSRHGDDAPATLKSVSTKVSRARGCTHGRIS